MLTMLNNEIIKYDTEPIKITYPFNYTVYYNTFIKHNINKEIAFNSNEYNAICPNFKLMVDNPHLHQDNIKDIKKIYHYGTPLKSISEYNSFFPENFYYIWEIVSEFKLINQGMMHFLFFDDDNDNLGHIEATIKYCEDNFRYECNEYTRMILEKPKYHECHKKFLSIYGNYRTCSFNEYFPNSKFDFFISISQKSLDLSWFKFMKSNSNSLIYITNFMDTDNNFINTSLSLFDKVYIYQPQIQDKLDISCWLILINYKCDHMVNSIGEHKTNLTIIQNAYMYRYIDKLLDLYEKTLYYEIDELIIDDDFNKKSIDWITKYKLLSKNDSRSITNFNDKLPSYMSGILNKYDNSISSHCKNGLDAERLDRMHCIKRTFNEYKRVVSTKEYSVDNDFDKDIIDWHKLTTDTHFYKSLNKIIAWKFNAEMVNNAWVKIYEIISREKLVDTNASKLKSFHLYENIGSCIFALNHYVKTQTSIVDFEWYANYYPINEFKQYVLMELFPNNWITDKYGKSNLRYGSVIDSYVNHINLENINLMICDGTTFVPTYKQTEQEQMASFTVFLQVYTMLYTLSESGNAIIKLYLPLAETMIISLLFLLTKAFSIVKLIKPTSCYSDTSEIYCVCKSYNGINSINNNIKTRMDDIYNNYNVNDSIFPLDMIHGNFIESLIKISESFTSNCINSIKRNLYLRNYYYVDYDMQTGITEFKENCYNKWIKDTDIKTIAQNDKLTRLKI